PLVDRAVLLLAAGGLAVELVHEVLLELRLVLREARGEVEHHGAHLVVVLHVAALRPLAARAGLGLGGALARRALVAAALDPEHLAHGVLLPSRSAPSPKRTSRAAEGHGREAHAASRPSPGRARGR